MIVWVVGQARGSGWDFQGVFSTEEMAVAACRDAAYFVGPAALDQQLPHDLQAEWPGGYYPLAPKES